MKRHEKSYMKRHKEKCRDMKRNKETRRDMKRNEEKPKKFRVTYLPSQWEVPTKGKTLSQRCEAQLHSSVTFQGIMVSRMVWWKLWLLKIRYLGPEKSLEFAISFFR